MPKQLEPTLHAELIHKVVHLPPEELLSFLNKDLAEAIAYRKQGYDNGLTQKDIDSITETALSRLYGEALINDLELYSNEESETYLVRLDELLDIYRGSAPEMALDAGAILGKEFYARRKTKQLHITVAKTTPQLKRFSVVGNPRDAHYQYLFFLLKKEFVSKSNHKEKAILAAFYLFDEITYKGNQLYQEYTGTGELYYRVNLLYYKALLNRQFGEKEANNIIDETMAMPSQKITTDKERIEQNLPMAQEFMQKIKVSNLQLIDLFNAEIKIYDAEARSSDAPRFFLKLGEDFNARAYNYIAKILRDDAIALAANKEHPEKSQQEAVGMLEEALSYVKRSMESTSPRKLRSQTMNEAKILLAIYKLRKNQETAEKDFEKARDAIRAAKIKYPTRLILFKMFAELFLTRAEVKLPSYNKAKEADARSTAAQAIRNEIKKDIDHAKKILAEAHASHHFVQDDSFDEFFSGLEEFAGALELSVDANLSMTQTIFTKLTAKEAEDHKHRIEIEAQIIALGGGPLFNTFHAAISHGFQESLTVNGHRVPQYEKTVKALRALAMVVNFIGLGSGGLAAPVCFFIPALRLGAAVLEKRGTTLNAGNEITPEMLLTLSWELAYHLTMVFKPLFSDLKKGKVSNEDLGELVIHMLKDAFKYLHETFKTAEKQKVTLSLEEKMGHFLVGALFHREFLKNKDAKFKDDSPLNRSLGFYLKEANIFLINPESKADIAGYTPKGHQEKYGSFSLVYSPILMDYFVEHSHDYRHIPDSGSLRDIPKEYIPIGSMPPEEIILHRRESDGVSSASSSRDSAMLTRSELDEIDFDDTLSRGRSSTGSTKSDEGSSSSSSSDSERNSPKTKANGLFSNLPAAETNKIEEPPTTSKNNNSNKLADTASFWDVDAIKAGKPKVESNQKVEEGFQFRSPYYMLK